MRTKQNNIRVVKYSLLIALGIGLGSCIFKSKTEPIREIDPALVTARYCYSEYAAFDTEGVHIYFAGQIKNNSNDTIWIPVKDTSTYAVFTDSCFYTVIEGDTLFFMELYPLKVVYPQALTTFSLHRYILPDETKWMEKFKNIGTDQRILDTLQIKYLSPETAQAGRRILPPIPFRRSKNFRIDTVGHNSHFEHIFRYQDHYEDPVKLPDGVDLRDVNIDDGEYL